MIEVKELIKKYQQKIVLNKINITFHKSEKVVIIGPSGGGKSTFLRCLNLLEIPDSGEIWLNDKRISNLSPNLYPELQNISKNALKLKIKEYDLKMRQDIDEARSKMGMVFQHFNLFNNLNVLDNITLAPIQLKKATPQEAQEIAKALLEKIDLYDKRNE